MSLFDRIAEGVGPTGLAVPIVRQSTDYTCGAAAMLAVFRYWRLPADSEKELAKALGTKRKVGTEPEAMAALAKHLGLRVQHLTNMSVGEIKRRVRSGDTIVLEIQRAGFPVRENDHSAGHYVVVVAADASAVYVMDPRITTGRFGEIPYGTLARAWVDDRSVAGRAIVVRGSRSLGTRSIGTPQKIRTGHEPRNEDEALLELALAPFRSVTPQAKATGLHAADHAIGPNAAMLPGQTAKGAPEPMNNPLPGNMDPRSAVAASGSRWDNARLARGRGDRIKALTPPPSLMKRVGSAEPTKPGLAGRPSAGPRFRPMPTPALSRSQAS